MKSNYVCHITHLRVQSRHVLSGGPGVFRVLSSDSLKEAHRPSPLFIQSQTGSLSSGFQDVLDGFLSLLSPDPGSLPFLCLLHPVFLGNCQLQQQHLLVSL